MSGQAEALVSAAADKVGEVVFVCAVPSDTLGWLAAQLDGEGDALVAALNTADAYLLTLPVMAGEATHPAWLAGPSTADTRLSEIMQRILIVRPPQAAHLEAV